MKTNPSSYLFACAFAVAVVAACGGSQGSAVIEPDGSVVDGSGIIIVADGGKTADVSITIPRDTGVINTTPDTGLSHPDVGTTEKPDTGSSSSGSSGDTDSGTPPHDSGPGVCPSSCTTNAECQTSCPPITGALNCCDAVTASCFQSAASACPGGGTGTDAGGGHHDGGY